MQSRLDRLFCEIDGDCAVFINSYPNIFYYSGFTSSDAFLILTRDAKYIITDSRYFIQARIESPEFELVDIKKGWEYILELCGNRQICFEENSLSFGMYTSVFGNTTDTIPAQAKIDMPRRVKDKSEILAIAEAEAIGDKAFTHILEFIRAGVTEWEIAVELETYMKRLGAKSLSFDTIVASGLRSAMPHGTASGKIIGKGDFLTLDFGCVYKGYCSDMTRTVVIGNPDTKQAEVYDVVLEAQKRALASLAVGIGCSDVDRVAREYIADCGYGNDFSHSLGHSVGIQIHESPVFSPKSTDVLTNGNVMSVEPGIYIDGWGGVRIEDLIAVDDGKIVNLTHSAKELIVI